MLIVGILLLAMVPVVMVLFLRQGAPFVRTSDKRTKIIINEVKRRDSKRIVDLGCGDGRLVITLASLGYRVDGIEIQPLLVWRAKRNVKKLGLEGRANIYWKSFWKFDVSKYDTVVIFGARHIMQRLEKKLLAELPPKSTVISNYFEFPHLKPDRRNTDIKIYKIN